MPIYEYRRPDGTTFELVQSFSDDALTVDPDSGVPVKRVLHAPALHFKGKGFYNTDYGTRNRQRETAAAAAEKPSSGGDSATSSTSEGKAEGKSDGKSDGKSKSETAGKDSGKDSAKAKDSKPVAAKS